VEKRTKVFCGAFFQKSDRFLPLSLNRVSLRFMRLFEFPFFPSWLDHSKETAMFYHRKELFRPVNVGTPDARREGQTDGHQEGEAGGRVSKKFFF
jgi:hypothetical protein